MFPRKGWLKLTLRYSLYWKEKASSALPVALVSPRIAWYASDCIVRQTIILFIVLFKVNHRIAPNFKVLIVVAGEYIVLDK